MNRTVIVDENLRELRAHGTAFFPFEVNHDEPMRFQERYIRCHWHDELELSLLLAGIRLEPSVPEWDVLRPDTGRKRMTAPLRSLSCLRRRSLIQNPDYYRWTGYGFPFRY